MGSSKCSGRPIFIFFLLKKLDLRHRAESNINILFTRNLSIDSNLIQ